MLAMLTHAWHQTIGEKSIATLFSRHLWTFSVSSSLPWLHQTPNGAIPMYWFIITLSKPPYQQHRQACNIIQSSPFFSFHAAATHAFQSFNTYTCTEFPQVFNPSIHITILTTNQTALVFTPHQLHGIIHCQNQPTRLRDGPFAELAIGSGLSGRGGGIANKRQMGTTGESFVFLWNKGILWIIKRTSRVKERNLKQQNWWICSDNRVKTAFVKGDYEMLHSHFS